MVNVQYYMSLPYDLSGSMAKNRFRNELLWGLKKIIDLYREKKDFVMVFDYRCDIEVHLKDKYEFYQIKTQNDHGTYTVNKLTKKKKSKNDVSKSVLATLYILKYDEDNKEIDETNVTVVSNAPLNDGSKTYTNCECIDLKQIDSNAVLKIKECLKNELDLDNDINMKNLYFIYTSMDLINPEKTLIGEISIFFEEFFKKEPIKVNSLYRVLFTEVFNKASYELELSTYEEIIEKKGISKDRIDEILNSYLENTDGAVDKVKNYINNKYANNWAQRIKLNKALSDVVMNLMRSKLFKDMEKETVNYIKDNIQNLDCDEDSIVETISSVLLKMKTIEISEEEINLLILLVLKKFEEGMYE